MNNLGSLVGFEFKKILHNKSVIISIVIAFIITVFSCFTMIIGSNRQSNYGSDTMSNYDAMLLDKSYEKEFDGRLLDGELIMEASRAYQKIDENAAKYTESEGYQKYARKYSGIYGLIDAAFAQPGKAFNVNDFQAISEETANNYYAFRESQYRTNLANNGLWSSSDIEKVMEMDEHVQKPFVLSYKDGYQRFFVLSMTTIAILLLVISFCFSPIFSNEYTKKTDALILSSKNGKGTFIHAKIVTSLLFSFSLTLLFILSAYFVCMGIYGFDGTFAQLQLLIPAITYDFTMLDAAVLILVTSIFAAFLHTSICLFISSSSKNIIIPMAVSVVLIAAGMFNGIDNNFFIKLRYFLPSAMGNFADITTQLVFNVFGIQIMLYQAVCIVAAVVGGLLLLLSYRNFKNHQVG
ncbi:MAG: hypothetical protein PHS82_09835 [Lachnospiraceae bacterium]|nr:hypothetical protein [Lachnospiraceae bacterium]